MGVGCSCTSGVNQGYGAGGYISGTETRSNILQYVDLTTSTGNATDGGNLTVGREDPGGI